MSLLESGENYLETIYMLSLKHEEVHAVQIANELHFSKPSVSIALKKLKDDGYIDIDSSLHIHLTEKGLEIALGIYERHTTLTQFFVKIGVPMDIAEEDACKIEHHLSTETFDAIKKFNNSL